MSIVGRSGDRFHDALTTRSNVPFDPSVPFTLGEMLVGRL